MTNAQHSKILDFKNPDALSNERKGEWILSCSSCDTTTAIRGMLNAADSWLAHRFRHHGWEVSNKFKTAKCPGCQKPLGRNKETNMSQPMTGSAAMASVRALRLIETNFDADKGYYLNNQSDGLIAATTGVSVDVVKSIREEEFGPIKGDPRLIAIKNDLEEADHRFAKDLKAAFDLIKSIEADHQKRYAALKIRLDDLGEKLR